MIPRVCAPARTVIAMVIVSTVTLHRSRQDTWLCIQLIECSRSQCQNYQSLARSTGTGWLPAAGKWVVDCLQALAICCVAEIAKVQLDWAVVYRETPDRSFICNAISHIAATLQRSSTCCLPQRWKRRLCHPFEGRGEERRAFAGGTIRFGSFEVECGKDSFPPNKD